MFLDLHFLFIFLFISNVCSPFFLRKPLQLYSLPHTLLSPHKFTESFIVSIFYTFDFFIPQALLSGLQIGWVFSPCFFSYSTLVLWDSLYPIHSLFLVTLKFSVWLQLHGWAQNQYFWQPSVWLFHWAIPPIIHIQWGQNGTLCSSTPHHPHLGFSPRNTRSSVLS